ncbi:MAG: hypothetical protein WDN08_12380 [Rhizomicrobium sp.]
MSHRIAVPRKKTKKIRQRGIDADASVTCFPNDYVEYDLNILRVAPGEVYKIEMQAIFYSNGAERGISRKATFYSNKPAVVGVPSTGPYSGHSMPSTAAVHDVDDFEPTGGASWMRHM